MELEITNLISSVGFPIAVTLWFMLRTEKIITENTRALEALKDMVHNFCLSENGRNKRK